MILTCIDVKLPLGVYFSAVNGLNKMLKEWQKLCIDMGVPVGKVFLHALLFADDQVVASDKYNIECMIRKLMETSWLSLKVNFSKIKYLVAGGNAKDLVVGDSVSNRSSEFNYLGSILLLRGNSKSDVSYLVMQGKVVVKQVNDL